MLNQENGKRKILVISLIAALTVLVLCVSIILGLYLRPIKSIMITNSGVDYHDTYGKYVVFRMNENETMSYQIDYKVSPSFLKKKDVKFSVEGNTDSFSVDENGLVTMTGAGRDVYLKVTVSAKDGRGAATDSIIIFTRPTK